MKQIDNEIALYCIMNCLISASFTLTLWFSFTLGGVISYVGAIIGLPGFLIFAIFRGSRGAYSFLKEYPILYFSANFILYSFITGLIQMQMRKRKNTKSHKI